MGTLKHELNSTSPALASRTLVGRSPLAQLTIADRLVSNEHAVIWYDEGTWWIRDLGSRNGTWINAMPATAHEAVALAEGDRISFGQRGHGWTLSDAGPPRAFATHKESGTTVTAEDGLLLIPSAEDPRLAAFSNGMGGWMVERDGEVIDARTVKDVALDGEVWTLVLPYESVQTWSSKGGLPSLPSLHFFVSSDEEHVEMEIRSGIKRERLPARAHAYFLLILARQRMQDIDSDVAPAEQGWLHVEDLGRMLRMDRATLNQRVFRARQQLAGSGLIPAADVIERRSHTGQIRLGISEVSEAPFR